MRFILHYAPDNASLVVRLVLDELGVPFDTQLVDRSRQAQKSPAFRALNPVGRIPVLETPDGPMSETAAILLWLADREGRMAPPPDHKDRAAFLRWLFFVSNTIHAELRLVFYPKTYTDAAGVAALSTTVKSSLLDHFAALDAVADMQPGWLGSEAPSVLDYYICACLRWATLYPSQGSGWFDIAHFPALATIARRRETAPAVLNAIEAEGLGPTPFSRPSYPNPPEGQVL